MEEGSNWLQPFGAKCEICHERSGNYRCPRCGIIYCCSKCYQIHNTKCVSSFSNDLIDKLKGSRASTEGKIKMQRILESSEADPSGFDVEVEPWSPWWLQKVIVNPPTPQLPPPNRVSPFLRFHLVDILYAYCYTMRLYNGDVTFDFNGASDVMTSISSVLNTRAEVHSVQQSLGLCIENSRRADIFTEFQWQVEVIRDVESCLQSKFHIYRAISEASAIAMEGRFKFAHQKLQFFFAWSQTISEKEVESVKSDVADGYTSFRALLSDVERNASQ